MGLAFKDVSTALEAGNAAWPHDMSTKPVKAVGAVIFDDAKRVLLVRRGRAPHHGDWSLPGGRVEPGEAPSAAVEREVLEETALVVRAEHRVETVTIAAEGFAYEIDDYLCSLVGAAEARAGDDALDVRWVRLDQLAALGVRAPAVRVIERAFRTRFSA